MEPDIPMITGGQRKSQMSKMNGINLRVVAILLIVAIFIIVALIIELDLITARPQPLPECVKVGQLFVDLDTDGDEDYLATGCAVFNNRYIVPPVEVPPAAPIPAPDILPTPEILADPSEL
jgi:hypothetical protein